LWARGATTGGAARILEKAHGKQVHGRTVALIVNPDKKVADVFVFKGFHHRIAWNSPQAKAGYAGSYRYDKLTLTRAFRGAPGHREITGFARHAILFQR
jgi:hypothetical protein